MKTLNISLCTDDAFVMPALVCLTSVFENNAGLPYKITVLTQGLSAKAMCRFDQLAKAYGQAIDIVEIDSTRFEGLVEKERFPISMYYRFLLPEILNNERVLYLDCDTIVRAQLSDLFETNLNGLAAGVVLDQQCDDVQNQNRLLLETPYFNSGVMLMNLSEWRRCNYLDKLLEYIRQKPERCQYPDQDALNVVLSGKVEFLGYEWNMQEMWLTMLDYTRFHFSRHAELEAAKDNPKIVHFCVSDKPWFDECRNPYRNEWVHYAKLHPFIGFEPRSHYRWPYFRLEAEKMRLTRWQKRLFRKL